MTYRQLFEQIMYDFTEQELNQDVVIRVSDGEHIPVQKVTTTTAADILDAGHIVLHADWTHTFFQVGNSYRS